MRKNVNRILMTALALVLLLSCAQPALAAGADWTSPAPHVIDVTLSHPEKGNISGVQVQLHKVADVTVGSEEPYHSLTYTLNDAFRDSKVELSGEINQNAAAASALYAFALKNKIEKTCLGTTDADGKVSFRDIDEGLYLISQIRKPQGEFEEYVFEPYLISIPWPNEDLGGGIGYGVSSKPKGAIVQDPMKVAVEKIWKGVNAIDCLPIDVQITGVSPDGKDKIILSATLTKDNKVPNQEKWYLALDKIVPKGYSWSLTEKVPAGFSAKYGKPVWSQTQDGFKLLTFSVTNTHLEYPLVQTGQLKWPVPVLALSGVVLIAAGAMIGKHGRKKHESEEI